MNTECACCDGPLKLGEQASGLHELMSACVGPLKAARDRQAAALRRVRAMVSDLTTSLATASPFERVIAIKELNDVLAEVARGLGEEKP